MIPTGNSPAPGGGAGRLQKVLAGNLANLAQRIEAAALSRGRTPREITLVAVTKTVPPEVARALLAAGQLDLGENRVPALEEKVAALGREGPVWHFIGPLQRNKARRCLRQAAWIHSVDSERLLLHLDRIAGEEEVRPRILLEVNLAQEPQKHGVPLDRFPALLDRARGCRHLEAVGLMTIAPFTSEEEPVRRTFKDLAELRARHCPDLPHLSMGMSQDLEIAVQEGATLVRVGSALFQGIPADHEEA